MSTVSRPACAVGEIWVNSTEGPEFALCDWQLFSAMQRTSSDSLQENWCQQSQLHVSEQPRNRVDYGLPLEPLALADVIPCAAASCTLNCRHLLARLRERWILLEG
jgi:hypothetical protein